MRDCHIVHYYHAASTPFRSISRLPKENAFALARSLHKKHPCVAFKRFGESCLEWYWERREAAEHQLYSEFLDIGGKPETRHPVYFALQGSSPIENLYRNFDKAKMIAISLSHIDPACISFTYGDSVALYEHPARRKPFMRDELYRLIDQYGNVDAFLSALDSLYEYIEAQVWIDL